MQFANAPKPAKPEGGTPRPSRMTLENVVRGKRRRPPRVFVYGAEKVGKSTFAAGAPSPVFFGKDEGTDELDITRLPTPRSFADMMRGLDLVIASAQEQGWKTLVIDPINWLEVLVHRAVAAETGTEFSAFEHATPALAKWRIFLEKLERVWDAGLGIVIVAHAAVKRVELPDLPAYDRFEPAMSPRPAGLFLQWADAIMFARQETIVRQGKKHERSKATTTGYRVLLTEMQPSYLAGNRMGLPAELSLSWDAFEAARSSGAGERMTAEIRAIAAELEAAGDEGLAAKVARYLDEKASLPELLNKLRERRERMLDAREATDAEKPEGAASDDKTTDTNNEGAES